MKTTATNNIKIKRYYLFSIFVLLNVFRFHSQTPDFAWARKIGNTYEHNAAVINSDSQGNSYISGYFLGSSLQLGSIQLNAPDQNGGSYIAKFDQNGIAIWAKLLIGVRTTVAFSGVNYNNDKILVDENGNVYLAATFGTNVFASVSRIDDFIITPVTQQNNRDNYLLVKFDAQGDIKWAKTSYTPDYINNLYNEIQFDNTGNICMTGLFATSISFAPGDTLKNIPANGVDAFVTTYDRNGNITRNHRLGSVNTNFSTEIFKLDSEGNIYRWVNGRKTFLKYDINGNLLTSKALSISGATSSFYTLSLDNNNNIFLGGDFSNGTLNIEGTSLTSFGSINNTDALLIKFSANDFTIQWHHKAEFSVNDSYRKLLIDDLGNIYTLGQHGDASETRSLFEKFSNDGIHLWTQIIKPITGTQNGFVNANNLIESNNGGNVWVVGAFKPSIYFDAATSFTTSGQYNTFLSQYGRCNTERPMINIASNLSFCTGDSIELTSNFSNVNLNYRWNTGATSESIYVKDPGNYYVIAIENTECYGKSEEVWITEIELPNSDVIQNTNTLTAIESGATYQWIDCTTQNPIIGATNQIFTASQNGSYAVLITNISGCSEVSSCKPINGLGINNLLLNDIITLYPNPATDHIQLKTDLQIKSITVTNTIGQVILQIQDGNTNVKELNVSGLVKGTYLLSADTEKGVWRGKFIKQ